MPSLFVVVVHANGESSILEPGGIYRHIDCSCIILYL